jgi:hypothetical protein
VIRCSIRLLAAVGQQFQDGLDVVGVRRPAGSRSPATATGVGVGVGGLAATAAAQARTRAESLARTLSTRSPSAAIRCAKPETSS